MTSPASPPVRGKKRWMKPLAYLIAFLFVPVLVGGATLYARYQSVADAHATPWTGDLPPVPEHQPGKRIAVVLAGNRGTEATDLIAPYQVLAASDSFNVYVVAPERRPSTLFPGSPMLPGVDLIPHLSFADYEARVGAAPDLIVIPFIPTATNTSHRAPEDAPIIPWVQEHASARTVVLSICGGAMTLADTGLLDGRPATSHQNVLRVERDRHPEIGWTDGRRYVEAGNIVSSAGITAGIDATLFVLGRTLGVTTGL